MIDGGVREAPPRGAPPGGGAAPAARERKLGIRYHSRNTYPIAGPRAFREGFPTTAPPPPHPAARLDPAGK